MYVIIITMFLEQSYTASWASPMIKAYNGAHKQLTFLWL
jgi:hypothetical protein